MEVKENDFLFVYGTLLQSYNNNNALDLNNLATYIGEAYIFAFLYKIAWYPAIVLDIESKSKVYGELYQLGPNAKELMSILDEYEGYYPYKAPKDCEYLRVLHDGIFMLPSQKRIKAWTYVYNLPVSQEKMILSGRFNPMDEYS